MGVRMSRIDILIRHNPMVSYLQIEGLAKSYGDRMLFADVTFGLYEGDKVGIIAPNGTGKSTLMSIIAGLEEPDSGNIVFRNDLRVGFLTQTTDYEPAETVIDYVEHVQRGAEDWDFRDRAVSMLSSLRITDMRQPMGQLSGGQLKRVALARVLLSEPQLLLLDEPTNHLDIDMIEWLESWLARQRVTLLMVTHDRYFLDRVCNKIIEIDRQQIFTYQGNYDYYLAKRQERQEALSSELAKVKNLLRTELDWMRRQPQARGSKAKYRIDNFHELEKRSQMRLGTDNVSFNVKSTYIGNKIFEAHGVCKSFGDKIILKDWDYIFARYDKVGVVGDNGVGKSTIIKMLLGRLAPDSGNFDVGTTVRFGYYSQEGIDFDEKKRVIDAVRDIAEVVRLDEKTTLTASQFLCHFLFAPSTQQQYIYKLSGGERRRLYLATVLMRSPNFLILDEPTNDLDIPTLAILEDYLARFQGCVIVVSHDRFFLDRVVNHLFVMNGDGSIRDFPGDYSTYRHCLLQERKEQAAKTCVSGGGTQSSRPRTVRGPKLSFKERKELENLEAEIPVLETEKKELEEKMSSGTMAAQELVEAGARIGRIIELIDEKEMRCLELMEKQG